MAKVPLPTSLWHVVNLLAAGKAPKEMSIYLSGASIKANCPPNVRPIPVGEGLRRLTSKYMHPIWGGQPMRG